MTKTWAILAVLAVAPATPDRYLQKARTFHTAAPAAVRMVREPRLRTASGDTLIGSPRGIVRQRPDGRVEPFPAAHVLPWNETTVIAEQAPGVFWIGTTRGAIRYEETLGARGVEYFAGRRWLPDDRVRGIGFEASGLDAAVWIETAAGAARIERRAMTLEEKSRAFEERVRTRHVRHGLTASSRLRTPGDLSTNRTVSSDNDGLWTAMYVAAECFRWAVTGEREARDLARQGIEAIARLEAITGIAGFPARSFVEVGRDEQPGDGEWHDTPDRKWRWKGDTSSDEIVGHYFGYAVYYDLAADAAEKEKIRAVVERITSYIVDHGYHLVDVDGKPTRWGWWAPADIWVDPDETGLRALHLLSHLKAAHHITGNPRWQTAYAELIAKHRYAELTRNQKINVPGHVNHSDDELAFLSYYPLLLYETDPALRKVYRESLERSWQIEMPERNPLWNFIYAVGTGAREYDRDGSIETLRRIPMDLVSWRVVNSHRLDLAVDPASDRFRRKQALLPLPPDERPMMKWNGNPYTLDGGDAGSSEDDGAFFLLPYWMGRYHKLIE